MPILPQPDAKREFTPVEDIPNPQQPNSLQNSEIRIPAPLTGIGAFNIFNQIANSVLTSQLIVHAENTQTTYSNDNEELNSNVKRIFNNKIMAPDAIPDGKGGFTASNSNYWSKRLSTTTGMPVMCPVTFVGTTYTALDGSQITIPTITFDMVMLSMKKGRNIEKTQITGRDSGSVKEYIGAKDWEIEMRAIVIASMNVSDGMEVFYQNGKYPEENMEKIDLLLNAPIAIKVVCPYMNKRGINYVVIDDGIQINQIEGEYEAQRLVIPMVSDNPLIIQISNGNT